MSHKSTRTVDTSIGVFDFHSFHDNGNVCPFVKVWVKSLTAPSGTFHRVACDAVWAITCVKDKQINKIVKINDENPVRKCMFVNIIESHETVDFLIQTMIYYRREAWAGLPISAPLQIADMAPIVGRAGNLTLLPTLTLSVRLTICRTLFTWLCSTSPWLAGPIDVDCL